MKTGLRRIASAVLLMSALAVPSYGWGNGGHMAVAYVAYRNLMPPVRDRVDALIKLNPNYHDWMTLIPPNTSPDDQKLMLFMIAATWPDQIKDAHHIPAYTADGPKEFKGDRPPNDGTAGQNIGYTDLAMHKYWHFIDEPFSQDGTATQDPTVPNAETQIAVFRTTLSSDSPDGLKSYDLVWLLHLLGDVHQPLHCISRFSHAGPNGDSGGNDVHVCDVKPHASTRAKAATRTQTKIKVNSGTKTKAGTKAKTGTKASAQCKEALHAFWDDLFGTSSDPGLAMTIGKDLPAASADLAGDLTPADWIQESSGDAPKVYLNPPIGPGDGPFQLTTTYHSAALSLSRERIALAGARLANVLNQELK
jgi:hypothetical protein